DRLVARQRLFRRRLCVGHGVADAHVVQVLDRRDDEPHLARPDPLDPRRPRHQLPQIVELVFLAVAHEPDLLPLFEFTIHDAPGKSILLMTGMISSPTSIAAYALATVYACTPCVASTTRIAPSHACSAFCTS